MSNQRYSPEFKDEAVRQVLQRGYSRMMTTDKLTKTCTLPTGHQSGHGKRYVTISMTDVTTFTDNP